MKILAFVLTFNSKDGAIRFAVYWLARLTEWLYKCQDVPVWRSADGRVRKITRMRDNHLENTIAMVQRNGQEHETWCYQHLLLERNYRRGLGTWAPGHVGKAKRAQGARHDFTEGRVSWRQ